MSYPRRLRQRKMSDFRRFFHRDMANIRRFTLNVNKNHRLLADVSNTLETLRTNGGKNLAIYEKHVGILQKIRIENII